MHRTLIGTPVGGAVVARYGYLPLSLLTGVSLLVGGCLVVVARVLLDKRLTASV